MREYKFRAWNKDTNNWLEGVTYKLHTSGRLIVIPSHVELMQFTGLHDKQGKEIYEGDIVHYEYSYPKDKPFVVKFDTQEFADSDYQAFCIGYNLDPTATEHYTIIGNLYQNPELLEATT